MRDWLQHPVEYMLLVNVPIFSLPPHSVSPVFPHRSGYSCCLLLYTKGLAPSSISTYIAAVRSFHIDMGAPDPTLGATRLARLLRGVCRTRSSPRLPRLPISNKLMHILYSALSSPSFDHVMFWAACCTALFGFLRVSEFTCPGTFMPSHHLSLLDLQYDFAGHFRLHLKSSKTDRFMNVVRLSWGHLLVLSARYKRYYVT
jgi:hypothetical protein